MTEWRLTRLPLLEEGFDYFRGLERMGCVILLGFLHGEFQKRV